MGLWGLGDFFSRRKAGNAEMPVQRSEFEAVAGMDRGSVGPTCYYLFSPQISLCVRRAWQDRSVDGAERLRYRAKQIVPSFAFVQAWLQRRGSNRPTNIIKKRHASEDMAYLHVGHYLQFIDPVRFLSVVVTATERLDNLLRLPLQSGCLQVTRSKSRVECDPPYGCDSLRYWT